MARAKKAGSSGLDALDARIAASDTEDGDASKGPSLAACIETRRFLGREFLVWLWFESELFEQKFSIEGFGECELWLEKSLVLESLTEAGKERATLSGVAPSGGPEAREALRQGKMPVKAKLAMKRDEQDFALALDADGLSLSGVKVPAVLKGEGDEPFQERITLIEELEGAIETLYREFLVARLQPDWDKAVVPAIRAWMNDEETPALIRYKSTRGRS
jgi:hypothetical protein